jgi:signal transduction histidine kinase/ActR/RegA family two-component response regulator
MKLSTRLILLVLGCLLPILAAQVYSQVNLHHARQAQVSALVLRQAELANAHLGTVVDAVGQLWTTVVQFPEIPSSGPPCDARLTSLQRDLPQYRFLALYRLDGTLQCGSAAAPGGSAAGDPQWIADLATTREVQVGPLVSTETPESTFLPIGIHIPGIATEPDPRVLVAALDAGWLARRLEAARSNDTGPLTHATLIVTDRDGAVVAWLNDGKDAGGRSLPEWAGPFVNGQTRGVATVTDPQGRAYIAAYVPATGAARGLGIIETVAMSKVTADIDRATYQDLAVIGGAALVALILAWVAGHRFIYQPTEALLLAARKWREGNLSARATSSNAGAEFSALAHSFNAMAAGLQAREMERRLQSSFLEAQVAERTRELSESNNRLQVEIAGREKTEAALHQAQKLQAVGQLAGGIAHDFNNMLATVLGNLELMERRVSQTEKDWTGSDTERLLRLIGRATGAVQRGSQLTSRLLAFSRRQRLAARSTDVNALLRELITLATSTLGRRVEVASELADELWPAMVDPSQVEAAILNLCLNARDAMPEGGRLTISTANLLLDAETTVDVNVHDQGPPSGCYVQICISDTGVGMTPEVKARAFDPFFTTKGPHGSGLGLSQVYGMARQSGGDAIIDSAPGQGTRVTLFLPRATPSEQAEIVHADRATKLALRESMPADLVLVVDDDAAVRQVTVEMARDLGCEVAQATGGEQALALIGDLTSAPTLILLDYAMPGMNGLQLARALRERGIRAPIALITGYAELSEADIAEAQLAGLLRKPFTIGELHGLLVQLRATAIEQRSEACFEPGLTGS